MILTVVQCARAGCDGLVSFDSDGAAKSGRVTGRCEDCGSFHVLYGGQVQLTAHQPCRQPQRRPPVPLRSEARRL